MKTRLTADELATQIALGTVDDILSDLEIIANRSDTDDDVLSILIHAKGIPTDIRRAARRSFMRKHKNCRDLEYY